MPLPLMYISLLFLYLGGPFLIGVLASSRCALSNITILFLGYSYTFLCIVVFSVILDDRMLQSIMNAYNSASNSSGLFFFIIILLASSFPGAIFAALGVVFCKKRGKKGQPGSHRCPVIIIATL